jgi:hypothetical protein
MMLEHYVWFACFCDLSIAAVDTGYCTLHDDLLTAGTLGLSFVTLHGDLRTAGTLKAWSTRNIPFVFFLMTTKPHAWGLQFLGALLVCFPKAKYPELSLFGFF